MEEKLIELLLDVDDVCDASDCVECDRINCFIHRAAVHLIANGVVVQRWIPVTERLPAYDVRVLVTDNREDYTSILVRTAGRRGFADYWENVDSGVRWPIGEFTHWMPLPEPPQEGQ